MSGQDVKEMFFNKNSGVSLGLVLILMGGVWWLSQSYSDILKTQELIQRDVQVIRTELSRGRRWTRENQEGWVTELKWRNAELNVPDPSDFVEEN